MSRFTLRRIEETEIRRVMHEIEVHTDEVDGAPAPTPIARAIRRATRRIGPQRATRTIEVAPSVPLLTWAGAK